MQAQVDRVCGQELRTVILDEDEETGKGKILDAGRGWGRARSVEFIPSTVES